MKLRSIKKTLENLNEAIKYIVFFFTMVIIAGYALFIAHCFVANNEFYPPMILDIIIAVVLMGLTISSKGSVSQRRTVLMTIFGLFTLYDVLNYAIFLQPVLTLYYSEFAGPAQILLYCGIAAGAINVLALVFRSIILVQYNVCENESIEQLSKENFKYSFNRAIKAIGVGIPNLFIYGLVYQGFGLVLAAIMDVIDNNVLTIEYLILGLVLMIVPILMITLIRRFKKLYDNKELSFAVFFAVFTLTGMICMIAFHAVGIVSLLCEFGYIFGISLLAFIYSIYLYILESKK